MEKDLHPIGRITKPHGIKGKMKVEYFGDDFTRFFHYREIFIKGSTGRPQGYQILEVIHQPPGFIIRLKGIEKREEVEPLVGKEILITRGVLPDLEEGEYYWFEILGMVVETERGKRIGRVKEIIPTGANDVFVVGGKRKDIFLPVTDEVIRSIDLKNKMMKVSWMEGLWEEEDEI